MVFSDPPIRYCDKENKIPVVYWGKNSLYYQSNGYNNSSNVWEYYFEPVSHLKYEKGEKIYSTYTAPDGFKIKWNENEFEKNLNTNFRRTIHQIIKKYIVIKPSLVDKINDFYETYMYEKKTIGIHIRGTDKHKEAKPVPLFKFIEAANKFKGY